MPSLSLLDNLLQDALFFKRIVDSFEIEHKTRLFLVGVQSFERDWLSVTKWPKISLFYHICMNCLTHPIHANLCQSHTYSTQFFFFFLFIYLKKKISEYINQAHLKACACGV